MPEIRVLNELQIKQNGVTNTYRLGTVNGYYNPTDGKFYEESTHITEIEGAPNLVYADIAGNNLYIWKAATSSFVKVSGEGGTAEENLKFGYLNPSDGLFYEDNSYIVEIPANADYLYISLDNDTIYRYDTGTTTYISIGGGGGSLYTAGDGITIGTENNEISADVDGNTIIIDANDKIAGNYEGDYNIKIDGNKISTKTFVGTTAEWEALTAAQKLEYDSVNITDDSVGLNTTPGHTIANETTSFPQRTNLQFEGMTVTDDSTNDITKVAPIPYTAGSKIDITDHEISVDDSVTATFTGTQAEWDALTSAEKAEYEIVNITDDVANGGMVVVNTVADGNMNAVSSNAVYDAINADKVRFWQQDWHDDSNGSYFKTIAEKKGNIVHLTVTGVQMNYPDSTWMYPTLPEGYRPAANANIFGICRFTDGTTDEVSINVLTNGDMKINCWNVSSKTITSVVSNGWYTT